MTVTPPSEDHDLIHTEPPLPPGLVLFPPGTEPRKKRRRLLFAACYLLVTAMLVWPVYPLFSGIRPLILGLPLSLAWIVLALAAGFTALVTLYLSEKDEDDPADEKSEEAEGAP